MLNNKNFYRLFSNSKNNPIVTNTKLSVPPQRSPKRLAIKIGVGRKSLLNRALYFLFPFVREIRNIVSDNKKMINNLKHYLHAFLCGT